MKKALKNTIMIGMAAVLIGTSAVTFSYASEKQHIASMPQSGYSQQMPDFGGKNDFSGGFSNDGQDGFPGGNQQTPQAPNAGGNQQQSPQAPNSDGNSNNNQKQQQPPQQNDSGDSQQSTQPGLPDNNNESEKSAESSTDSKGTSTAGSDLEFEQLAAGIETETADRRMMKKGGFNAVSFLLYAFCAVQVTILLMILVYLILSKFNRLSFNTVFPPKTKE